MTGLDIVVGDAVSRYVERKSVGDPDGSGSGTYATNAESILRRWTDWLAAHTTVRTLADLERVHLQAYARALDGRVAGGAYTASTARTYFAVVRAFLSWCVAEGALETNPAATDAAIDELPSTDRARPDGRRWSPKSRRRLEAFVRDRASAADDETRPVRMREYALIAVVAQTDLRGAELFRVPEDDRRTGATWADVDFYSGTVRVLGKSQRLEDVAIPAPARTPLRRYRVALDPPTNEWPLFPTRHAPSIASRVRTVLRERGRDEESIEALMDAKTAVAVARARAIPPPAITTEGARSILRRLCEAADVDVDGEYLTPRNARRDPDSDSRTRTDATPSASGSEGSVGDRSLVAVDEEPTLPELLETDEE